MIGIGGNTVLVATTTSPGAKPVDLDRFARRPMIRKLVHVVEKEKLGDPKTSSKELAELAKHCDPMVRQLVATHRNTSASTVKELTNDSDWRVRQIARQPTYRERMLLLTQLAMDDIGREHITGKGSKANGTLAQGISPNYVRQTKAGNPAVQKSPKASLSTVIGNLQKLEKKLAEFQSKFDQLRGKRSELETKYAELGQNGFNQDDLSDEHMKYMTECIDFINALSTAHLEAAAVSVEAKNLLACAEKYSTRSDRLTGNFSELYQMASGLLKPVPADASNSQ